MIEKPNRQPDYISNTGAFFFFKEMVMFAGDYKWELEIDTKDNALARKRRIFSDCWCNRCANDMICSDNVLKEQTQEAYRNWCTKELESTFGIFND